MRVLVMVPGDKNSEKGVMPTEKELSEMMKFNEELVKAGVMLAGEGLHDIQGQAGPLRWQEAHGHRRSVHGVEGDRGRLLDLAGEVPRRSDRVDQALRSTAAPRSS